MIISKYFNKKLKPIFLLTETNSENRELQMTRLLNLFGPDCLKLYNTFKITDVPVDNIIKKLQEYCVPRKTVVMEHYKYFKWKQAEDEPFGKLYADLCDLVKSCSFGETEKTLLRTQVVRGIKDKELQSRLLSKNLPLKKSLSTVKRWNELKLIAG